MLVCMAAKQVTPVQKRPTGRLLALFLTLLRRAIPNLFVPGGDAVVFFPCRIPSQPDVGRTNLWREWSFLWRWGVSHVGGAYETRGGALESTEARCMPLYLDKKKKCTLHHYFFVA